MNQRNDQEMQQKHSEVQLMNEQINQMQQRINMINQQVLQLKDIVSNLEEFKKAKKDSKLMFSVGPGVYAEGELKEDNLIVNVGSNILVKKSVPDTIEIIKEQVKELENVLEQDEKNYNMLCMKLQNTQSEIANISQSK